MSAPTVRFTPVKTRPNRFVFLDIFRGLAPLLVIYAHIVALFLGERGERGLVVNAIDQHVRIPLKLEQDLGHLAVVMFFLVSGFIITHMGVQESHREFGIKRLFRVYPLLVFTVLLTALLTTLGLQVMAPEQGFPVALEYVFTNMLLVNYLQVPQVIMVGVAWTLIIEVTFYLLVLTLLAVLRRWTWLAIAIELAVVLLAVLLARSFGASFFLLAVSISYLPVVITGQIVWAAWSRRVRLPAAAGFGLAAWLLYVLADLRGMGRINDAYLSTFALGLCLFVSLLLLEPKLRPIRWITFLSERSYSLYLMHGPVSFPVMIALYDKVPVAITVLAGVAATMAATEVTYRFVEMPGQRFARRLTRRMRLKRRRPKPSPSRPKHRKSEQVPVARTRPPQIRPAEPGAWNVTTGRPAVRPPGGAPR